MSRGVLRAVKVDARRADGELVAAVRAALDGSGPAVLPVPREAPELLRAAPRAALRPDDEQAPVELDDVALVVPTSGTTGEPKGTLLTAAAVRASAVATADRLSGQGRWVLALPVTHVAGLMVLARAVLAGHGPASVPARAPGVNSASPGFDVAAFAGTTASAARVATRAGRPLYTSLVPTQLERLLAAEVDLRAYDAILLGAAAAPRRLLERAAEAGATVVTTYGMTETCGGCVYDGRPLAGVTARTDDADAGVPGSGGVGRLLLGGPTVAGGYRLRPDLTAASFTSDGWFRSGDLGRWDGQTLSVLGRLDDVIVSGGEKVVPGVVESALAEVSEPGTRWCVVGVADEQWGQRVVAVAQTAAGVMVPDVQTLRGRLRAMLPAAWLPRDVVGTSAVPMLATGKIDRAAVGAMVTPARLTAQR